MQPVSLNLRHLRAVTAIVDTGTLSAAARAVSLTQPAITQAIAKLEDLLHLPLFDRGPGGMTPTEGGRLLAARAQRALDLIESSRVTAPQMRALIALARHGSYAAAAKALEMREPSLHRAVTDLSVSIGSTLVERRGKGVALTPRGSSLARRFRLAQAELDAARAELERLRGLEVGRIAIGAMPLSRAKLLPDAVGEFHRLYPDMDIAVVEGSHAELLGPLREGDIDLMIGALRDTLPDDFVKEPLFVDRPIVLGRAGHPLAESRRRPTARQLAGYRWIVPPPQTPLRMQWKRMFESSGVEPPRVPIECGSVLVIRQLLMKDDFLTLLSPVQVAVELQARWLVKICDAPGNPQRTIGITSRASWRPTQLQQHFVDLLKGHARRIEASKT